MVKISYTNIIVDQFSSARNNPFNTYVHFLSHIHTDHLKGLSNLWDYGPIYCSAHTKRLILLKYPKLECLKQLELDVQHTIRLSSQLSVTVTLFDANHCAGGVMFLFEGFMGTVLYTGDIRYNQSVFSEYTYLYPHAKRTKDFKNCSIPIDFLYLDTTFLHPKFHFPPKQQAMNQLDQFIQSTIDKAKQKKQFIEFYIGIDTFGKEEVLVHLAEKFSTFVTVSQDRYKNISVIGLDTDLFSTDPAAGFIHAIVKRDMHENLSKTQNSMGIVLTGWASKPHFRTPRLYAIPYSLHSSYPELCAFVDSLRPCFIETFLEIGPPKSSREQSDGNSQKGIEKLYEEIDTYEYLKKLRKDFTSEPSEELKQLTNNFDLQKNIMKKLKLDRTSAEINYEEFSMTTTIIRVQNLKKAGAKFSVERNQHEIQQFKERLKTKKDQMKNKLFSGTRIKKTIAKPIRYQGLQALELNQNQHTQLMNSHSEIMQIEDSPEEERQQEEKSQKTSNQKHDIKLSRQPSNENIENSNKQGEANLSHQQRKDASGQEDASRSRKNKYKKIVESGQIDLFGPVILPSQKLNNIRPSANNRQLISLIRQKVSKSQQLKEKFIEIIDDDEDHGAQKSVIEQMNSEGQQENPEPQKSIPTSIVPIMDQIEIPLFKIDFAKLNLIYQASPDKYQLFFAPNCQKLP